MGKDKNGNEGGTAKVNLSVALWIWKYNDCGFAGKVARIYGNP